LRQATGSPRADDHSIAINANSGGRDRRRRAAADRRRTKRYGAENGAVSCVKSATGQLP
jgi:hypothetical protein